MCIILNRYIYIYTYIPIPCGICFGIVGPIHRFDLFVCLFTPFFGLRLLKKLLYKSFEPSVSRTGFKPGMITSRQAYHETIFAVCP